VAGAALDGSGRSIESYRIPLDDPLPLLLADPRGVETTHLGDSLWLRPVDVERLLGGRAYPTRSIA
jgi:predicted acetyltransferase